MPQPLHKISGGLKRGSIFEGGKFNAVLTIVKDIDIVGKTRIVAIERRRPGNVTFRISMRGQQP
ncbi:MAG TPA: hypothetical protein VHA14_10025 [Bryobacteraceae bacterium]|nr:hypothetical protein [Bryobacteraceae bacterium]